MNPRLSSLGLAAAFLLLPALTPPAWAEKPLPPAFGKELVPDRKANEAGEPKGPSDLEELKEGSEKRPAAPQTHRPGRGGRVKIQLDGDEDGGGEEDGEAGSDPDAGDF